MAGIVKIATAIVLMAVTAIAIAHTAMQSKWLSARRIAESGYILVCKGKKSMTFTDHDTAVSYWKRAFKRGIRYTIYEIRDGAILRMP